MNPNLITERRKIGSHTYELTQFGALEGRSILIMLTRMVAPGLAAAAPSVIESGFQAGILLSIGDVVSKFAESVRVDDFVAVTDAIATRTRLIQGGELGGKAVGVPTPLAEQFDTHFAGRYDELLGLVAFAVELNGFFGALLAAVKVRPTSPTANSSQPSMASTGGSGAPVSQRGMA